MIHFSKWFIIIKRIHTAKKKPSTVLNAVKDKKLFDLVKIEQRKTRKRLYEDRPFKEGDKALCSSRIKEAKGGQNLYRLLSKWKNKSTNIKDI